MTEPGGATAPVISSREDRRQPMWIDVRDVRVAYRRAGRGEPVLYLHGGAMTRAWLTFYEELARHVDLIAPEHPGFGDTALPDWLGGFDDLVLHYADLLDALELGAVHVVGHSIGAWIAAELGAFHPDRFKSLTVVSPFGLRVPGAPLADVFRIADDERAELFFNAATAEGLSDRFGGDGGVEDRVRAYAELTTIGRLMWNPRYDIKLDHRLQRITCPALVIAPDEDRIVPRAHFERWAELLPNARLQTVHGRDRASGHGLVLQAPEQLAEAIVRFVGDLAGG